MTLTAVSLFSGAGGFCEGMRLAGWKIACAVEADAQACLTHAANFDDVALFKGDITRSLRDPQPGVPSLEELVARKIDVAYGGPPCQGFSQIGPRKLNDPRNRLYKEFVRVVRLLRPRAFVMENDTEDLAENGTLGVCPNAMIGSYLNDCLSQLTWSTLTDGDFRPWAEAPPGGEPLSWAHGQRRWL
jgi:site-specific DNA-cytosine methylase